MELILLIVFIAYCIYNGLQVIKGMAGRRYEKPVILFFFACFLDFFAWVRSKF